MALHVGSLALKFRCFAVTGSKGFSRISLDLVCQFPHLQIRSMIRTVTCGSLFDSPVWYLVVSPLFSTIRTHWEGGPKFPRQSGSEASFRFALPCPPLIQTRTRWCGSRVWKSRKIGAHSMASALSLAHATSKIQHIPGRVGEWERGAGSLKGSGEERWRRKASSRLMLPPERGGRGGESGGYRLHSDLGPAVPLHERKVDRSSILDRSIQPHVALGTLRRAHGYRARAQQNVV